MDVKLSTTGDIDISSGGLELVTGSASIAQGLLIGLRFFQGEWYLDLRVGIPYLQQILGKKPRPNVLRAIFRKAILASPGVLSVRSLVVDFTAATRTLGIKFEAVVAGEDTPISFSEEIVI